MATIRFDAPDDLVAAMSASPDAFARDLRLAAAMWWYGNGSQTMGGAAALAGLTQAEFMHTLKLAGQETAGLDPGDLDRELGYLAERRPRGGSIE
jgi:hypothetical protein